MSSIKIRPFVGKSYNSNNIFGKKIMVLGESHYGNEISTEITNDVVNAYLDPNLEREGWMNTYLKFERSLVNKETTKSDSKVIWDSLLFYNYVQELMDSPRLSPTKQQFENSSEAFYEVLEENEPEVLIIWGKRLWSNLPYKYWEEGDPFDVEGYTIDNGQYKLANGHVVKAVCVYHPSSSYDWSYWYKVISQFLNPENGIPIKELGFNNFRRFKDFPSLELGGVNIIVGPNNAGKSTFAKASMICLDFLKNWISKGNISLNFTSDLFRKIGINSYEDAHSYYASSNGKLKFDMTIGRYSYEVQFESPAKSDNESTTTISAEYIKVIDSNDLTEYIFNYSKSESKAEITIHYLLFTPSTEPLQMIEKFLYSPMCTLDNNVKDELSTNLDVIQECIGKVDITENSILSNFEKVENLLGEDIPSNIYNKFRVLKDSIPYILNCESVVLNLSMPRNISLRELMNEMRGVNVIQEKLDESKVNNVLTREIEYVGLICADKHQYSILGSNEHERIIANFCRKNKTEEVIKFINHWLKEFNIGTSLSFDHHLDNEIFSIYVSQEDGKDCKLSSMGSGTRHIVELIVRLANFVLSSGNLNSRTIIIEEPEVNLHPNLQSKLADLFTDFNSKFGIQIIVETHSENLVRKLQVVVVKYLNDRENVSNIFTINSNIKVYYFPEVGMAYQLLFRASGFFDANFGNGFLDEAQKNYIELLRISTNA